MKEADVILLSYNHLIHQQAKTEFKASTNTVGYEGADSVNTRVAGVFNIELENSVLLIDEGHNISENSDEVMSFAIEKVGLLEGCRSELRLLWSLIEGGTE
jgi:Rad3-related DNA helicase